MANPWLKKNPFLSMWLSGANAVFGAARGQTAALAKRQGAGAVKAATTAYVDAVTGKSAKNAVKRKKRAA